ncbi:MAG TPA: hypothetical protein DF296_13605 [Candidatus Margulisbacteria bacterium]|nr:hypothetical protein [Candidatus Margulisiibacteriota bacterium]
MNIEKFINSLSESEIYDLKLYLFKKETKGNILFTDFLNHEKKHLFSEKLAQYIKDGRGKHVGTCLAVLINMNLLSFTKNIDLYRSLFLDYSQISGANNYLNNQRIYKIDEKLYEMIKHKICFIIENS